MGIHTRLYRNEDRRVLLDISLAASLWDCIEPLGSEGVDQEQVEVKVVALAAAFPLHRSQHRTVNLALDAGTDLGDTMQTDCRACRWSIRQ